MGGLFSKKKTSAPPPNRITEQDKAVLSLKQQRDKLKQYQKKINLNLERERLVAKQLLQNGKKEKAKTLLKKKRYQENLLEKTDNQLENIDKLIQEVEFAQVELKVVEGLKQGNEALTAIHKMMSLEDVEQLMDETKEAVEYQREIDALLSGGLSEVDEDEIMKELDQLTAGIELPSVPDHIPISEDVLPDVPSEEPTADEPHKAASSGRVAVAAS